MKIAIINGPNLNLLGKREPDVYGSTSFDDYFEKLKNAFPEIEFSYFQSNIEGEIIDRLQDVATNHNAVILNPAGYTHTSVSIGDAVAAIQLPVIEVHISNIFGREPFRQLSYVSAKCRGTISGLGLKGYALAVQYFFEGEHTL